MAGFDVARAVYRAYRVGRLVERRILLRRLRVAARRCCEAVVDASA